MQLSEIESIIKGHEPQILEIKRSNAILIPLIRTENGVSLLYEVRSENVWQPGEICFPGGGIEEGETVEQAAVRECCEELGTAPADIQLLGRYDTVLGLGGFILYTCVGILDPKNINFNEEEVADFFTVPLDWLTANPPMEFNFPAPPQVPEDFDYSVFGVKGPYNWRKNIDHIYAWEYNNKHIWGLTAKITKNFVDFLNKQKL